MENNKNVIKLTEDQHILLHSFLTATKNEGSPNNFSEWGEEWLLICKLSKNITNAITRDLLTVNDDQYFAVFNFLASFVNDIKREQKGEELFNDYSSLFIHIKESYELKEPSGKKYSPYIYISKYYIDEKPLKKIHIDPNSSVEDVLRKYN